MPAYLKYNVLKCLLSLKPTFLKQTYQKYKTFNFKKYLFEIIINNGLK